MRREGKGEDGVKENRRTEVSNKEQQEQRKQGVRTEVKEREEGEGRLGERNEWEWKEEKQE